MSLLPDPPNITTVFNKIRHKNGEVKEIKKQILFLRFKKKLKFFSIVVCMDQGKSTIPVRIRGQFCGVVLSSVCGWCFEWECSPYDFIAECLFLSCWSVYEGLGSVSLLEEVSHWDESSGHKSPHQAQPLLSSCSCSMPACMPPQPLPRRSGTNPLKLEARPY